jgi:hypothetical protein
VNAQIKLGEEMISRLRRGLDPLDLEIVERACYTVLDVIRGAGHFDPDMDAALETVLRRELVEIVWSSGVGDPEALLDILVDLSDKYAARPQVQATEEHAPATATRSCGLESSVSQGDQRQQSGY